MSRLVGVRQGSSEASPVDLVEEEAPVDLLDGVTALQHDALVPPVCSQVHDGGEARQPGRQLAAVIGMDDVGSYAEVAKPRQHGPSARVALIGEVDASLPGQDERTHLLPQGGGVVRRHGDRDHRVSLGLRLVHEERAHEWALAAVSSSASGTGGRYLIPIPRTHEGRGARTPRPSDRPPDQLSGSPRERLSADQPRNTWMTDGRGPRQAPFGGVTPAGT